MNGALRRLGGLARIVLGLLALGVSARVEAAEPPGDANAKAQTVLLLPLEAEGVLASDREALEDRLRSAFEDPAIAIVTPTELGACAEELTEPCLRELGRDHAASHIVRAEIVADGRDYVAQLIVLAVDGDGPASLIDAGCQICGFAEFDDRLAARAVAARDLILATPQVGRLELVGHPDDARVRIDKQWRGRLPYDGELSVGPHELIVSADGHYRKVIPIDTLAGVSQRLVVDLAPKPVHDWRRPTGWALLGSGIASVVTGSALIGVHGSPATLRCSSPDPSLVDADGDCRWLRRTLGAGVGLTAVGLAAAATGTTLLVIDARRRSAHERAENRNTQISARVGLDYVELQIRF